MASLKRETSTSSHMALKPGAIAGIATAATIVTIALCVLFFLKRRCLKRPESLRRRSQDTFDGIEQPQPHFPVIPGEKFRNPELQKPLIPTPVSMPATGHHRRDAPTAVSANEVEDKEDDKEYPQNRETGPFIRRFSRLSGVPNFQSPPDNINPWELEYEPNPVIFPHLAMDSTDPSKCGSLREVNEESGEISPFRSSTPPVHSPATFKAAENTDEGSPITPPNQAILSLQDEEKNGRWEEGQEWGIRKTLEAYTSKLGADWHSTGTVLKPVNEERNISTPTLHNLQTPITPPETPAQSSTVRNQNSSYACPACHLIFSTAGLQRDHYNRRHNRRYICTLCNAAFNLRSDLQRHEGTVHKDDLYSKPSRTFTCPNVSCTTPGKEYARKDNFKRHVERCKRASARAAAHVDGMDMVS